MASVFIAALAFTLAVVVAATYPVHKEDQDLYQDHRVSWDQHVAAEAMDLWNEETQNKVEDGKDRE